VILTLFVIAWQSIATAQAAESTQESVKAAMLNAQTVINAERARLLIDVTKEL
jgi:hypothetical protein